MEHIDKEAPDPEFHKLSPHPPEEELIEAQENFDGYLEVVWRIYERIGNAKSLSLILKEPDDLTHLALL